MLWARMCRSCSTRIQVLQRHLWHAAGQRVGRTVLSGFFSRTRICLFTMCNCWPKGQEMIGDSAEMLQTSKLRQQGPLSWKQRQQWKSLTKEYAQKTRQIENMSWLGMSKTLISVLWFQSNSWDFTDACGSVAAQTMYCWNKEQGAAG